MQSCFHLNLMRILWLCMGRRETSYCCKTDLMLHFYSSRTETLNIWTNLTTSSFTSRTWRLHSLSAYLRVSPMEFNRISFWTDVRTIGLLIIMRWAMRLFCHVMSLMAQFSTQKQTQVNSCLFRSKSLCDPWVLLPRKSAQDWRSFGCGYWGGFYCKWWITEEPKQHVTFSACWNFWSYLCTTQPPQGAMDWDSQIGNHCIKVGWLSFIPSSYFFILEHLIYRNSDSLWCMHLYRA